MVHGDVQSDPPHTDPHTTLREYVWLRRHGPDVDVQSADEQRTPHDTL
jgi:hypothetical protein